MCGDLKSLTGSFVCLLFQICQMIQTMFYNIKVMIKLEEAYQYVPTTVMTALDIATPSALLA